MIPLPPPLGRRTLVPAAIPETGSAPRQRQRQRHASHGQQWCEQQWCEQHHQHLHARRSEGLLAAFTFIGEGEAHVLFELLDGRQRRSRDWPRSGCRPNIRGPARIVGGQDAEDVCAVGSRGWPLAVCKTVSRLNSAAALSFTPSWVLTAAHCIEGGPGRNCGCHSGPDAICPPLMESASPVAEIIPLPRLRSGYPWTAIWLCCG